MIRALPPIIANSNTSLIPYRQPRPNHYAMTVPALESQGDPQPEFTFQAVPVYIIYPAQEEEIGYDRFGMLTKLEARGIFIDWYL